MLNETTNLMGWTEDRLWQAHEIIECRTRILRHKVNEPDQAQSKIQLQMAALQTNETLLERIEDELFRRGLI